MGYFSADEHLEQAGEALPAPWGLRGVARRVGGAAELELDWQRPHVPLDGFSVLLLSDPSGNRGVEIASVAGGATHCRATLPLEARADCLSVAVVARHGTLHSPPSSILTLYLSPRPTMMNAEPPAQLIVATPPPVMASPMPAGSQVELLDDLGAIDAALGEAQAYLGQNGVFVRFKHLSFRKEKAMATTVATRNEAIEQAQPRNWTVVGEAPTLTCRCCDPGRPLIPRAGQGDGPRYALCLHTGRMHLIEGEAVRLQVSPSFDRGGEGGGRPDLAPGVRVDLSRDTYA